MWKQSNRLFAIVLVAASLAQTPLVRAQGTGAQGHFVIFNDTEENIVVGFYTNDGSGWSTNWLSEQIQPGGHATATFTGETGPCEQTLQVGWLGQGGNEVLDDPIDIDICEASNVYLGDNDITFD